MEAYCQEHGFESFAYVGDAPADLPIWKKGRGGVCRSAGNIAQATDRRAGRAHRNRGGQSDALERFSAGFAAASVVEESAAVLADVFGARSVADAVVPRADGVLVVLRVRLGGLSGERFAGLGNRSAASHEKETGPLRPASFDCRPWCSRFRSLSALAFVLSLGTARWRFCAVLLMYLGTSGLYSFWLKRQGGDRRVPAVGLVHSASSGGRRRGRRAGIGMDVGIFVVLLLVAGVRQTVH